MSQFCRYFRERDTFWTSNNISDISSDIWLLKNMFLLTQPNDMTCEVVALLLYVSPFITIIRLKNVNKLLDQQMK